jgi:hypothetical protein
MDLLLELLKLLKIKVTLIKPYGYSRITLVSYPEHLFHFDDTEDK